MKFEIKSWATGAVLFSIETDSWKLAIEAAVKSRANLQYANLQYADLQYADLQYAILRYANLQYADLRYAILRYADLQYADLRYANLQYADLRSAILRSAILRYADLQYADLRYANLQYADLRYANLQYAKGINKHLTTPLRILLDQPGQIRAYKLTTESYKSPIAPGSGNGCLKYEIGAELSVSNASADESEQCAAGISLATLDWCMKEWRAGFRIMLCEFTVADIAAIPTCTDGKFRVHRCTVVGEKDLVEIGLIQPEPEAAVPSETPAEISKLPPDSGQ